MQTQFIFRLRSTEIEEAPTPPGAQRHRDRPESSSRKEVISPCRAVEKLQPAKIIAGGQLRRKPHEHVKNECDHPLACMIVQASAAGDMI